jgi:hypothetical protein
MKKIHYVASLVVKRVEVEDGRDPKGYTSVVGKPGERTVGDVTAVTIRAAEISNLRERLKDQVLLIEDDIDIPLGNSQEQTRG